MPNIVGVKFKQVGKVYFFSPNDIEFKVGDGVIVETSRGIEYGEISVANTEVEQSKIVGTLKPVQRKATEEDKAQFMSNCQKAKDAFPEAQERIKKHNLEMKLVDVEYAFDNSKIIFYFTAENRVDFRDLVKDLAAAFRSRIELRQIGIRDECKQKGGLGPCGRPCCCNSFLNEYERVSIKMAKNQGLSLSPTKINGLCGRLMCCLKYEDEYYAETLKFMPKVGSDIETPDGKGSVVSNDLLRQKVKARVILKNGDIEMREYSIKDLKIGKQAVVSEIDDQQDSDMVPDEE